MKAKSRGSCSSRLIGFLFMVVVAFMLIGPLLRCAQQLPQMAANATARAASGVAGAAGNTVRRWGRGLLDRVERIFGFARDQWDNADPAGKFDLVCEHVPVEGVDKLCPYFTSALKGASDALTAQTACYWHAAATSPESPMIMKGINTLCPQKAGDPTALQKCLAQQVDATDPGTAANCESTSPEQLWAELHTMIKPIACPPGLPESLCTTQSSASATASNPSPATRTDVNYLNCLQYYYLKLPAYNQQLSCGTVVNAQNASCARSALQAFTYQGQSYGAQQVAYCDAQP